MNGGNATDKRGVRAGHPHDLCVLAFALASLSTLAHVLPLRSLCSCLLDDRVGVVRVAFCPAQQAGLPREVAA